MLEEECESLESDEYGSLMGGEGWRSVEKGSHPSLRSPDGRGSAGSARRRKVKTGGER